MNSKLPESKIDPFAWRMAILVFMLTLCVIVVIAVAVVTDRGEAVVIALIPVATVALGVMRRIAACISQSGASENHPKDQTPRRQVVSSEERSPSSNRR